MSKLTPDKVLRVNCPGFGTSSILPLGEAKPLAMYEAIVVNPTSILHLFETKSANTEKVASLQAEGMTSLRLDGDGPLESIAAEMELREQELRQFLSKGGLLICFLAPPFVTQGSSLTMDNYFWLYDWTPDKCEAGSERNMSATIRGKKYEVTESGKGSPFHQYLQQSNLEWSTIIRTDNIQDGFVSLAEAGSNKCIALAKDTGPKMGQVVFLPAPYLEKHDKVLQHCMELWYALHTDDVEAAAHMQAGNDLQTQDISGGDEPLGEPSAASASLAEQQMEAADLFRFDDMPAASNQEAETSLPLQNDEVAEVVAPAGDAFDNVFEPVAESSNQPQELMNKLEQEVVHTVPEWCRNYSLPELDSMKSELEQLHEQVRLAEAKIKDTEAAMGTLQEIKDALLSAQGVKLTQACVKALQAIGWQVEFSGDSSAELWLMEDEKTQAIARINFSSEQPNRAELAELAESVITYWGRYDIEPKGILIASAWAETPIEERTKEDFSSSMVEFARRKNLCLLTCKDLLNIYRQVCLNEKDSKSFRDEFLSTSGLLAPSFTEASVPAPAPAPAGSKKK